jgi:hypothetical protein
MTDDKQPGIDRVFDPQAIEKELTTHSPRPPVSLVGKAMAAVDRDKNREVYQIEALIDQALHMQVAMVRGAYLPGPRDVHVRKMILELVGSIAASNSHDR